MFLTDKYNSKYVNTSSCVERYSYDNYILMFSLVIIDGLKHIRNKMVKLI